METIISGVAWAISASSFIAGVNFFNNTSKIVGILLIANALLVIHLHNKVMIEKELDNFQAEMNLWESENYY
jgi:hypothetical protein